MSLWSSEPAALGTPADTDPFPPRREVEIGGRRELMRRTGTAIRKKLGVKFFRIVGYVDADVRHRDIDAVAAADVPKQLILVMERDIPESLLRRGFEQAFAKNDPEQRHAQRSQVLLDHMAAEALKKGDCVTLTHLPQVGVECKVCDDSPITIGNADFAHLVWRIYMGPYAVTPEVRAGLASELTVD